MLWRLVHALKACLSFKDFLRLFSLTQHKLSTNFNVLFSRKLSKVSSKHLTEKSPQPSYEIPIKTQSTFNALKCSRFSKFQPSVLFSFLFLLRFFFAHKSFSIVVNRTLSCVIRKSLRCALVDYSLIVSVVNSKQQTPNVFDLKFFWKFLSIFSFSKLDHTFVFSLCFWKNLRVSERIRVYPDNEKKNVFLCMKLFQFSKLIST